MTVYIDDMRMPARVGRLTARWSHLQADTTNELVTFAARLGLRREWIQDPGTCIEHFDVTESKRRQAIRLGATPIHYGAEGAALTEAKRSGRTFDLTAFRSGDRG